VVARINPFLLDQFRPFADLLVPTMPDYVIVIKRRAAQPIPDGFGLKQGDPHP